MLDNCSENLVASLYLGQASERNICCWRYLDLEEITVETVIVLCYLWSYGFSHKRALEHLASLGTANRAQQGLTLQGVMFGVRNVSYSNSFV